jgi:hypothetical protein
MSKSSRRGAAEANARSSRTTQRPDASRPDPTRKQRREQARDERRAREAARRRSARVRRRLGRVGASIIALVAAGSLALVALSGGRASPGEAGGLSAHVKLAPLASLGPLRPPDQAGPLGPEAVPIPNAPSAASTASKAAGQQVDGIECSGGEQTLFHIHAHLTILVNGARRQVPYGIGVSAAQTEDTPAGPFVVSGSCFYWLHTHAADGIIHIESPVRRAYTLGNFFDIWAQPLSSAQVGLATGPVTAIYDGQRYVGNPRDIPLSAHAQIQLEVGRPLVAPDVISFPPGL